MYKKWLITQDNNTNSWKTWLIKTFDELENILLEVGAKDISKKYTWNSEDITSKRDCDASKANDLQIKGYPDWILNLKDFKNISNQCDQSYVATGWAGNQFAGNRIDGFFTFTLNDIKYCMVYNYVKPITSYNYDSHHCTMLIDYSNVNIMSVDKKYRYTISKNNANKYGDTGLLRYGVSGVILVEYITGSYIDYLTLTFNGDESVPSYYEGGKFFAMGYYKVSDKYKYHFPSGFLSGGDGKLETENQLMFQSDSEGLSNLINSKYGDVINSKYLIGKIHYGIKNSGILGQLQNAVFINNNAYPLGTSFIVNESEYKKIRLNILHDISIPSISSSNYGSAFANAFHRIEV